MHAFLLVCDHEPSIQSSIDTFIKDHAILPFNTHIIEPNPTLGISQIRQLTHSLKLKPFEGGERLVIFKHIDMATLEAQNALLKLLEEPPERTYIIATTSAVGRIIDTIVSRCKIIYKPNTVKSEVDSSALQEFVKLLHASPGERIQYAIASYTTREDILSFFDRLITDASSCLRRGTTSVIPIPKAQLAGTIRKAISARTFIQRNVNFKATLDVFLLGLPKI